LDSLGFSFLLNGARFSFLLNEAIINQVDPL
jgi:hypothetical protein